MYDEVISELQTALKNPLVAATGRVRGWVNNPEKQYPFSCSGIVVKDSYFDNDEGDAPWQSFEGWHNFLETIAGSRVFCTQALKGGAGVAVDLSNLRPFGTDNHRGLTAMGVTNFLSMYSMIVEEVQRGNTYKNGASCLYLDSKHPDIMDFLKYPKQRLPWAKRAVYVGREIKNPENSELRAEIIKQWADGTIFLAKRRWDIHGERLFTQVCTEIYFKSRSTCTLMHLNAGQVETYQDVVEGCKIVMSALVKLWWCIDHTMSPYRSQMDDPQVGMGIIGLANCLANFDIKYADFVNALRHVLDEYYNYDSIAPLGSYSSTALNLANAFLIGFKEAGKIAKESGLERAFTIAPTSSSATQHVDYNGFTTTPEISPAICHPTTHIYRRNSQRFGQEEFQYPMNVEVASHDVPFETYFELACQWQRLMGVDGLDHAISFNLWTPDITPDEEFLYRWLDSPLYTTYYRWPTQQQFQDKTYIPIETDEDDVLFWAGNTVSGNPEDEICLACAG
jgi:hypothetical protein